MGNVLSSLDLNCPDRVRNRYDSQASAGRKASCVTGGSSALGSTSSAPLTPLQTPSLAKGPTATTSTLSSTRVNEGTEPIAFTTSAVAKADVATSTSFHDLADASSSAPTVFLVPTIQAVEVSAEWKVDEDDPVVRPECVFPSAAVSPPFSSAVLAPTIRCTTEETVVAPFHFESTPMPVREPLTSAVSKRRGSLPIPSAIASSSSGLVISSPEAKAGLQRLRRRKQTERRRTQSFRETSPRYPIRSGSTDLPTSASTSNMLATAIAASSASAKLAENVPAKVDLLDMDEQLANEERLLEEEFQNLKSQITTPRVPLALQDCMAKSALFSPTKSSVPPPPTARLTTTSTTITSPPPSSSSNSAAIASMSQILTMTPHAPTSTTSSVAHGLELPSPGSTEKENDPRRASFAGMSSPLIPVSTPRAFPKPEICPEFKPTPTKFEDCSSAMKQQREEIQARLAARIKASEEHTELLRNLREKDRIIHDLMEQNVLLTRAAVSGSGGNGGITGSGRGGGAGYSGGSGSEGGAVTPSTTSQSNSSTARSLPPPPAFRQGRSKSAELKYRSRERSLSGSRKPTLYSKAKEVEASDEWSEDRSLAEDSHDD